MRRLVCALALVIAASALAAPAALAASVKLDRTALRFTGARHEANAVRVSETFGAYMVEDSSAPSLTAGMGCVSGGARAVACPVIGFSSMIVDLGDNDDTLDSGTVAVGQVNCGPGTDAVTVAEGTKTAPDCESVTVVPAAAPVEPPSTADPIPEPPAADEPVADAAVAVSSHPVRVDAQGRVPVAVSCPATSPDGCVGRVTLSWPHHAGVSSARRRYLGRSKRFKLAPGQRKVVRVKLSRRASRIIKRRGGKHRRVKLAVTVTVASATGEQSVSRTITVRLRRR